MSNKPFEKLNDEQWSCIQQHLGPSMFPKVRGKPRNDLRKIWNSILYVLIRGCRWKELPQGEAYAPRSSAHRWLKQFQTWGVFDRVLTALLRSADAKGLICWDQMSVDGSFSPREWRG